MSAPTFEPGPDRGPLLAVGLTAVVGLVALGLGATVPGVVLVLFALAGAVAFAVGPVLSRRTARVQDIVVPRWVGPDAVALAAEQRRLLGALGEARQVATVVRPRLAGLVASRLRARGIEPGSEAARALQGAPLTAFLDGDRPGAVSSRAFAALLDRVEAL